MNNKIFIVIPAFNEEEVIEDVLNQIQKNGYKNIIIVDDGSFDQTYQKIINKNVTVLRHILNRGKGAAIKTGIEAAKILGADSVITFDGDGQHDPADIEKIQNHLKQYDVVLGTRSYKDLPKLKKILNILGNLSTFLIYGLWVKDSQSGLRGFSKKALFCINTQNDRYEYDSEVIREIGKNKLKYIEIPIKVKYTKYSQEKLNKQGIYNGLKTVLKMIISA